MAWDTVNYIPRNENGVLNNVKDKQACCEQLNVLELPDVYLYKGLIIIMFALTNSISVLEQAANNFTQPDDSCYKKQASVPPLIYVLYAFTCYL